MNKKWRGRIFRYTPFILWTGVVLAFSTGGASMNRTSRIIRPILEFLFPAASEAELIFYHAFVRKSAHFFEYAVLAGLAYRAFAGSSKWFLANRPAAAAFIVALLIASADETYQSFDPARTGAVTDVLIDLSGAAVALVAATVYRRRVKN